MRNRRIRKTKKILPKFGLRFFFGFGIIFLVAAGGLYLYEVNSATIKGFQIKELEKKVEDLRTENKKLENQHARYESMTATQEKTKDLQMIPSKAVEYVTVTSGGVAKK